MNGGASLMRQALKHALGAMLPRRRFLLSGPRASREVCFTFDDGPHPEHTPRLLDVLGELGATATFFVVGQQVERYPQLVRRIAAEGHLLGHHSYWHAPPEQTSAAQLAAEIAQTRQLLADLVGAAPRWFRPPLGKLSVAKCRRIWQAGQGIALWNVDPRDYACRTTDECRERLLARPLVGGDVVLLHDVHPHAAHLLPEVIGRIRDHGLAPATLDAWSP